MSTPIKILIVEDSEDDATLLVEELRSAGFDPTWKRVETETDYCNQLKEQPDVIFSDFTLPQFSTPLASKLLRQSKLDIPFIIVSGTIGEEHAVESMRGGATDYVLKNRLFRLGPVVARALLEKRNRIERKQIEAQFIEAQKMEVIGQLASGIAHDFNNILAIIMGYSDLLSSDLPPDSLLRKHTEEIRLAAERAAGLTRQLLVFSRKQTVQPVVLDLNAAVKDLEKMLRRIIDENIEMTITPAEKLGRIKADSGYIGQVLMNLVVNARDAMPAGGKVSIATSNVTLDQKEGGTLDHVMLSVTDTGTGMTDEVKAHMFEAFFTTKTSGKGTGLGLATCQTVVRQCGGQIRVESEVGRGTVFKVYFPRVDEPVDPGTQFLRRGPLPRGTETLLLVEDEPSVRHLACGILESQGYTVLSANNGLEGLHVAQERKGPAISLVISDVIMPQMGGKVMSDWLKVAYPDIKILFTSGYTDDALAHHGVLDIGIAFLPKPYTSATLTRKVREILDAV
jgi:two-component system cell cycle sensor histidine kinase/response regulator CckA